MKIDGKQIASEILENLKKKVNNLKEQGITPCVAIILVGNDPASVAYVAQKVKKAEKIGTKATVYRLPSETSENKLLMLLKKLNDDEIMHGVIIQRPLPSHINPTTVNEATNREKDIDAFRKDSPYQMPLAEAVIAILKNIFQNKLDIRYSDFIDWLKTKNIVVVGKGETGGRPTIELLRKMNIEPIVIDSKTMNHELLTRSADIVVSTVGKPNILKAESLKKGVILIGVGMHRGNDGKLHGDYNEEEIKDIASFYTPIPDGVGPMNVAMLLKNLVKACDNFTL